MAKVNIIDVSAIIQHKPTPKLMFGVILLHVGTNRPVPMAKGTKYSYEIITLQGFPCGAYKIDGEFYTEI